jgi:hypothetical protein
LWAPVKLRSGCWLYLLFVKLIKGCRFHPSRKTWLYKTKTCSSFCTICLLSVAITRYKATTKLCFGCII